MSRSLHTLTLGTCLLALGACASDPAGTAEPLDAAETVEVAAAEIPAGTYALDPTHSEIGFRVRHLGIANVDGTFNDFDGTVVVPESGLDGLEATLTARVASIDTDNDDRNAHLRSPDFFAADEFPELTFTTTSVEPTGGNAFRLTGDLTMRGTTRPVTLEGEYLGTASIQGQQKIGFEASGELDRQDWGLSWAETNEAGEIIVSDDVTLVISAEADLQDPAAAEPDA